MVCVFLCILLSFNYICSMSLFNKIDQVLARFGNMKAMQRTHVDTYTECLIENVAGEQYGISDYGELWISYQELAGYYFINTSIISATDIKTNKGASLEFLDSESKGVLVNSDDHMIESDFSNVSNRWLTKINYCVDEDQLKFIQNKEYSLVKFKFKKAQLVFEIIK